MNSSSRPRNGDVVVSRRRDGRGFDIAVVPGEAQILAATLNEALARAQTWATGKTVTVWIADEHGQFRRANIQPN